MNWHKEKAFVFVPYSLIIHVEPSWCSPKLSPEESADSGETTSKGEVAFQIYYIVHIGKTDKYIKVHKSYQWWLTWVFQS